MNGLNIRNKTLVDNRWKRHRNVEIHRFE